MSLDTAILDTVDLAYRAAIEPGLWREVLQGVSNLTAGDRAIILDGTASRSGLPVIGFEDEALTQYFEVFYPLNPIQAAIGRQGRRGKGVLGVTTDLMWVDPDSLHGSAFYNDYFRPFGMHASLQITLGERGQGPALNVMRPRRGGEFEGRDLELATLVQGPLSRAWRLGRKLQAERRVGEALAQVVERATGAVVLADRDGRIVHANRAAEALFRHGDGIQVMTASLRAASPSVSRRLAQLVGAAAGGEGASGAIALPRPSGRRPLAALVAPAWAEEQGQGERLAIISITDPDRQVLAPQDRLRDLFGLTAGEARAVAELVAGHEPRRIAERLGLSLNTVRVQLARAMAKCDTGRQSELVSLIIRTVGLQG